MHDAARRRLVPLYEVAGWPGHRHLAGSSSSGSALSGITLAFRMGTDADEAEILVTTYVGDTTPGLEREVAEDEEAAGGSWSAVTIPVDGVQREFDVPTSGRYWRAFAALDTHVLRLCGHDVSPHDVALQQVLDVDALVNDSRLFEDAMRRAYEQQG